jgi:hypothetical protein
MLRAHCFALCWALATVSRIAGHATVAFTLQVYFYPSEDTAGASRGIRRGDTRERAERPVTITEAAKGRAGCPPLPFRDPNAQDLPRGSERFAW